MDKVEKQVRSRMMAGIAGKDTGPERIVRSALHQRGFRYRLHSAALPGHPDLYFPAYRAAILVHGCFWHRHQRCDLAYTPKSNKDFWINKLAANRNRDRAVVKQLRARDVRVLIVWECAIRDVVNRDKVTKEIVRWLRSSRRHREIGKRRAKRRRNS